MARRAIRREFVVIACSLRVSLRVRCLPGQLQQQVGGAGLEAGEVDGDVDVAELAEARHDPGVAVLVPEAGELVVGQLDTGQTVVMTDAELAKAELLHECLGGIDLAELVGGDAIAVLEARRQTCKGRLVPRRQPEGARELADLRLGEARVDHGRPHAALPRRLHAGPVVAEVVDVGAVDERTAALALGDGGQLREQLLLAEEAATRPVLRVLRIRQLVGPHDDVTKADQRGQLPRLRQLTGRIRLGVGGDEHRPIAERVLGRAREQRGVDAGRECHDHALELPQRRQETGVLRVHGRAHGHGRTDSASSASERSGRAPTCEITSAAARAPSRPHVGSGERRVKPTMNPAAYRSPAPVVSTTAATGSALITWTLLPDTITEPRSLRVTAATSHWPRTRATAASKSCTS